MIARLVYFSGQPCDIFQCYIFLKKNKNDFHFNKHVEFPLYEFAYVFSSNALQKMLFHTLHI